MRILSRINIILKHLERREKQKQVSWAYSFKCKFNSVQYLNCVQLCVTPWTVACQASLSITNSRVYSNLCPLSRWCHPTISSCCPLLLPSIFPNIRVFSNESALCIRWPNYIVSDSASVLPMNIQDWFPLGWTGWISLHSKGLSRVFSYKVQKLQFFSAQVFFFYSSTLTSIHDYQKNHSFD